MLPEEQVAGKQHEQLIRSSTDVKHQFRIWPSVIRWMLDGDRWKRMQLRDGKFIEHSRLHDWILTEPREGLGMRSWDDLYAILSRSEEGREVMQLLRDRGAPVSAVVADATPNLRNGQAGNGRSFDNIKATLGGTSADYLAARLKRDAPDIAAAVERGEIKSIRAGAIAAGIVRQKTPIEHLRAWWRKANADERAEFRAEIETV